MRRRFYILLFCLVWVLSACQRLDPDSMKGSEILLKPEVEALTKATGYKEGDINSLDDVKAYKFGFMGYDSVNKALNGGDALKKGISFMWNGSQWMYSNVEAYRWTKFTPPIDFYAYYPLQGLDMTVQKFQSPYDPSGDVMVLTKWFDGVDVLYGRTLGATSSPVEMTFKHAFTKIEKVNFRIPDTSNLTFHIAEIELTATHTEKDGKIVVRETGGPEYRGGATRENLKRTLSSEVVVNKHTGSGGVNLIVSSDNAFMFPVTVASDLWDGTPGAGDIALDKTCVHLKAKVKQGEEVILQGSGEYVIGSESQYGDIYIPIRGTSNSGQTLDAGKKYTINIYLKKGVGFNKDGKTYEPIDLSVTVDDWVQNTLSVGQVTVKPSDVTLDSAHSYEADVVVNAMHTDLSKLSAACSSNLSAAFRVEGGKVYLKITRSSVSATGTGTVTVNDQESNSMTTVNVSIQ